MPPISKLPARRPFLRAFSEFLLPFNKNLKSYAAPALSHSVGASGKPQPLAPIPRSIINWSPEKHYSASQSTLPFSGKTCHSKSSMELPNHPVSNFPRLLLEKNIRKISYRQNLISTLLKFAKPLFMNNIRIAIADDHNLFRRGLSNLIGEFPDMKLVVDAIHGQDLLEKLEKKKVDVLLLDVNMPVMDGFETASKVLANHPKIKIIILTSMTDEKGIMRLIEMGIHGYVHKDADIHELETAINRVKKHEYHFNERITRAMAQHLSKKKHSPNLAQDKIDLNEREQEVLKLICLEFNNEEIARKMYLSKRTIEGYKQRIMSKTGARNLAGLIKFALKAQIMPNDLFGTNGNQAFAA